MNRREIPRVQQCAFCQDRWLVAIGGYRLCRHHLELVEAIAADAGVAVHTAVRQLGSESTTQYARGATANG